MAPILSFTGDREEICELIWEDRSALRVNYEGTLAYIDNGGRSTDVLHFTSGVSPEELGLAGIPYNIMIAIDRARSFHCTWYNGSDSPMDTLTLEEFYRRTEGLS